MATLPAEGRWSVRTLPEDGIEPALEFLRRDPLVNVYLIARLIEERTLAASQMVEVRFNRDIVLIASLATNIVLGTAPATPREVMESAVAVVADRIITRMLPVRAIISPANLVDQLWTHLRSRIDPPTVVRMTQPIYAIRRRLDFPDLHDARFSMLRDLDALVPASAAMHKEEVVSDPMERDAAGYRERVRELIERKRSVIRVLDGAIVSKCEISAVTDEAVQLMGVWSHPRYRRRGVLRACLREVCGHLFRKGKTVTLFVNDFNKPAIGLYESLGFQRIGVNRALIW